MCINRTLDNYYLWLNHSWDYDRIKEALDKGYDVQVDDYVFDSEGNGYSRIFSIGEISNLTISCIGNIVCDIGADLVCWEEPDEEDGGMDLLYEESDIFLKDDYSNLKIREQ